MADNSKFYFAGSVDELMEYTSVSEEELFEGFQS